MGGTGLKANILDENGDAMPTVWFPTTYPMSPDGLVDKLRAGQKLPEADRIAGFPGMVRRGTS